MAKKHSHIKKQVVLIGRASALPAAHDVSDDDRQGIVKGSGLTGNFDTYSINQPVHMSLSCTVHVNRIPATS